MQTPWLGLILLPIAIAIVYRSRALTGAGRWLIRVATALLLLATLGVSVDCDRQMRIVAWVDVSPSTRGATFRNTSAVDAKLKQLVPGRQVEIRYFADGEVITRTESMAAQTHLPSTDADAVVLMSDGRFIAPPVVPPVYAVIDPALDAPADARLMAVELENGVASVTAHASTADRVMRVSSSDASIPLSSGPSRVSVDTKTSSVDVAIVPADAWPENDRIRATAAPNVESEPWVVTEGSQLPTDATAYLAPSAIVIPAAMALSGTQVDRLTQYARDLGGSLVIVGSPREMAGGLKPISPLTGTPPEPDAQWMILLDASGSMATTDHRESRWRRSLAAAAAAVERLDASQRVSVAVFSRTAETVVDLADPANAIARIWSLANRNPSGPTGLESALESIANRLGAAPTRLLLITDADATIESPRDLIDRLKDARASVFVLATGAIGPDAELRGVADQTGGALVAEADSRRWSGAMRSLMNLASGEEKLAPAAVSTTGAIRGVELNATQLFLAYPRADVEILANASDHPIAATWQVGLGRVIMIAADIPTDRLASVAERLKRSPADPRLTVTWDRDSVVLTAVDSNTLINGLVPTLVDGTEVQALTQTAPGRYEAAVPRSQSPRIVRVTLNDAILSQHALPGLYAKEFDAIGNDPLSLTGIASRSGGEVIDSAHTGPIRFKHASERWSTAKPLLALAAMVLGAAIVFIRAPYLTARVVRYARRSVR